MKKKTKYILSFLVTTLAACIIGKIFDPFLSFCYSKFLFLGTLFAKSFSDATYQSISDGFSEKHSLQIYCFFLLFFIVLLNFMITSLQEKQKSILNNIKKINNKLNSTQAPQEVSDNQIETSDDPIFRIRKLQDDFVELKNMFSKVKKEYIIAQTFFIFCILILFFSYARQCFINDAITSALNNIEIVSPYITDNEYKQLKSNFYSIQSKDDYDSLFDALREIAEDNSIVLKK